MKQSQNQALGKNGENVACTFLEKAGHKILQRNYRNGRSELDIISLENSTIVISEVKSFYAIPQDPVEFRVNKKKQRQIIRGAYGFLDENPKYQGYDVRLDVIIVNFTEYPAKITLHQGAFYDDNSYYY
jgi:putative endonuclease